MNPTDKPEASEDEELAVGLVAELLVEEAADAEARASRPPADPP